MRRKALLIGIMGFFFLVHHLSAQWWTPKKRLTWNSGGTTDMAVATDANDNIYIVWDDDTPGNYEIFFKMSTNSGTTWITKRLTFNVGDSYFPDIAIGPNNNINVVWYDDTIGGYYEIFFKKSTDGGATWTTKRLTFNSDDSWSSAIAVDSNNHIHVVWTDFTPGNSEVFYKKSTDFVA